MWQADIGADKYTAGDSYSIQERKDVDRDRVDNGKMENHKLAVRNTVIEADIDFRFHRLAEIMDRRWLLGLPSSECHKFG